MLVERGAELEALRAATAGAARGAGSSTVVVGPPGIGKSALLEAVGAGAGQAGDVRVLTARGGELETEFPYGLVRQLYEGVLRTADDDLRAALLAGPARPAGALLGGEVTQPPGDAAALEHALYWLTVNLADRRPVVLLVDDLHWADLSSLRSLIHLARRVADHPVALITTTRPGEGPRRALLDRLAVESATLELAPISEDGVRQYVHQRLSAADDAFGSACYAASGGNPFLVSELVGAVQASRIAPVAANASRVRSVTVHNVKRSVLLRLSGMSPDAVPVARAIAVLGEAGRLDVVAQLAGVPAASAGVVLDELRAAHLVSPGEPMQFVHSIVRSAVYGDIAPSRRSQSHHAAARLMADTGASADAVAAHLLLTLPGSDRWVFEQLSAAASSGLAASTPETAAAYLERALRETVVDADERVPLLLALGAARYQTLAGGAVEPLREALATATGPRLRMECGRALASAHMTEQRYDEAWALIARLLDELAGHPEVAADVEVFAAQALFTDVDGTLEQHARVDAWRPDVRGTAPRDRSMLAVQAWVAMHRSAPWEAGAAMARAALSSGSLLADDTYYVTYDMAVWALVGAGRFDEALASLDTAIGSRRAVGQLLRAATLMPVRAEVLRRLGRLDDAEQDARLAYEIIPAEQVFAAPAASVLALVLLDRGEPAQARTVLASRGYDVSVPGGGMSDLVWFTRGRLRVAEGDRAGGVEDLLRFGAICDALQRRNPGWFPWRSAAAAALGQLGRVDEARRLAGDEGALADTAGVPGPRGRALGALGTVQRGDEAVTTLTAAVELLDGSPLVLDAAEARIALGRALRLRGRREAAREPLRHALDTATAAGARSLAERANQELVAAGARPRRQAMYGSAALTPSERQVASLAAQGLTNRELAHTLFVTPKTIEAHLASAYRKLGIAGRAGLAGAISGGGQTLGYRP